MGSAGGKGARPGRRPLRLRPLEKGAWNRVTGIAFICIFQNNLAAFDMSGER